MKAAGRDMRPLLGWAMVALLAIALPSCASTGTTGGGHKAPSKGRHSGRSRSATGVEHLVQKGESLWKISQAYGVTIESIALANDLGSKSRIDVGQRLFIPGATSSLSPVTPATPTAASGRSGSPAKATSHKSASASGNGGGKASDGADSPRPASDRQGREGASTAREASPTPGKSADAPPSKPPADLKLKADDEGRAGAYGDGDEGSPAPTPYLPADEGASSQYAPPPGVKGKPLSWPVRGVLYARFGKRAGSVHDGIDIAAPEATPIRAADAGQVIFSAPQPGYGNLVILQHEGGILTLYAHNRENLVKEGDKVRLGQVIARMGTGTASSGPYLHFEVRVGGAPKNPLDYLPPPR